ncbi:hypothetical protein BH11ARM1_BH11ARM1_07150 [soil metagenome]
MLIPPNQPLDIRGLDQKLMLTYGQSVLAEGSWAGKGRVRTIVQGAGEDPINQVWAVTATEGSTTVDLKVMASDESFPCQVDRTGYSALPIVRNSFGVGTNRLNRAIYDRHSDWVLSVDPGSASVDVIPGELKNGVRTYTLHATGDEIILRFRPRYYQKHRGLKFFAPWTYKIWDQPVVGWSSWYAYFTDVDEKKMGESIDALADTLKPFGLTYIQIDDGFQQTPVGSPDTWLHTNSKFPSGLTGLVKRIHDKGLKAGVWSSPMVHDNDYANANPSLFVKAADGSVATGRWTGHPIDGSSTSAHEQYLKPMYGGLAKMGWDYFKVDSIRHLRYEGYNSFSDYFKQKGIDREGAYRSIFETVRHEVGDKFFLACWGIRPELIGLADGCRIGDDGFAFAGLSQFNSWNNVVWRNDPDHIELSPKEGYRSCMTTSLTGALFMVTDKAERYRSGDLEAAKRTIPVLFTRPGQLFDVDPTRSDQLSLVDTEVSGAGPRPFDASRLSTTGLFQLDLNMPYESWSVLGRTDERDGHIPLADMGLDSQKPYLLYEFWTDKFLGSVKGSFDPGAIDPAFGCQSFCLRPQLDHPQVLASRRHISCGALEMSELVWKDSKLSGTSELVKGDPYRLLIHEPAGFGFSSVDVKGATLVSQSVRPDGLREIVLSGEGKANWTVRY